MSLYRRSPSKIWYVKIKRPDGTVLNHSTGTENKQLATEFHDKTKSEMWNAHRLGYKADVSFSEAATKFLHDKTKVRRPDTQAGYEALISWWVEQFKGLSIRQVTQEQILNAISKKEGEVSGATCNRYLAALRACLTMAHKKFQYIERVPSVFMYPEPKERVRFLKPDEVQRLLDALPPTMRDMAAFSLATGLRQSNVLNLRWDEINLEERTVTIDAAKMKGNRTFSLPLNDSAIEILVRQVGKHHNAVFTNKGKPVRCVSSDTWKAALERAGIEDFRWHDLRHTWASHLAQAGVPNRALQVLGAWETPCMVTKYAHHDTESVRAAAKLMDSRLGSALKSTPEKAKSLGDTQFDTHPPQKGHLRLVA